MKYIILLFTITFSWIQCNTDNDGILTMLDTLVDIDGNVYKTIAIGNQIWMAENLKVTHYRDGMSIPTGYSNTEWVNLYETETGAYAVYPYNHDDASVTICNGDCSEVYGNLYNWYAVDTGNLAPDGWHIPTDEEWMELVMELGMDESEENNTVWRGTDQSSQIAGSYDLWTNLYPADDLVNNPAFSTSGFNALPSGYRYYGTGSYSYLSRYCYFWSSTECDSISALGLVLYYRSSKVARGYGNGGDGFSIRCIRD